jgi:hypothetical protein
MAKDSQFPAIVGNPAGLGTALIRQAAAAASGLVSLQVTGRPSRCAELGLCGPPEPPTPLRQDGVVGSPEGG